MNSTFERISVYFMRELKQSTMNLGEDSSNKFTDSIEGLTRVTHSRSVLQLLRFGWSSGFSVRGIGVAITSWP